MVVQGSLIAVYFLIKLHSAFIDFIGNDLLPYFLVSAFYLKESIRHKRTSYIAIVCRFNLCTLVALCSRFRLTSVVWCVVFGWLGYFSISYFEQKIAQTKPA